GPAERVEFDPLDTIEVHGDGGNVTEEAHAIAVGRNVDIFGNNGAIELQRIETGLPLDSVATVTRVPHERIVAGPELGEIVSPAADHDVVAGRADQHVVA